MAELTRNLWGVAIDSTKGATDDVYTWVPVDKSTTYELGFNAQTDTKGYISDKNDSTVIKSYQVAMDQEITLDNENPLYKFMRAYAMSMPVGADAECPVLVVQPDDTTGLPTVGLVWPKAMITPTAINSVDGILTFNIAFNGDPVEGTVSGWGTGTVTFTKTVDGGSGA